LGNIINKKESLHFISIGVLINVLQYWYGSVYVTSYNISVHVYEKRQKLITLLVVANAIAFQSNHDRGKHAKMVTIVDALWLNPLKSHYFGTKKTVKRKI